MKKLILLIFLLVFVSGCTLLPKNVGQRSSNKNTNDCCGIFPSHIYKTKRDYYNNVVVRLSEDKKNVTSYPDGSDIRLFVQEDEFGRISSNQPIRLNNGYLLTGAFMGKEWAFTNYNYKEYHDANPSSMDIIKKIKDFNPFTEMWECPSSFAQTKRGEVDRANLLIDNNQLNTLCKKVNL